SQTRLIHMGLINVIHKVKLIKLLTEFRFSKLKDVKYLSELFKSLWQVEEVRDMLKGYKTYIVAILAGVVTAFHAMGYIDDATYQTLMALLGAGAVGTVAAKINRINADKK